MRDYEVSKNLEQEPRIAGYKPQLYILLFILRIVYAVIFVVYLLSQIADGSKSGFITFLIVNGLLIGLLLFLAKYFKKVSGIGKYNSFKKERSVLSNKNIINEV